MTTTPERAAFYAWLRSQGIQPTGDKWESARILDMQLGWDAAIAARQSAPESCRQVDDCTESLCMQANRCKHTLPHQPQRLCVEQSEDRRDAERYRWLRKWLTENGLLRAVFCRPDIKAKTGDWWVLHKPYGIISDSCVGYAKTDDAAIDAAMRA